MFQVHQRQTERMRHRSEWFLSDPTGMVTVKCRPSSVMMMTPTNPRTSPVPSGPPSLPCSRPPPLPSSQPPRPSPNCSMGRLSPNVSCDNMSISPMATMSTLPKSSLPMASKGLFKFSAVCLHFSVYQYRYTTYILILCVKRKQTAMRWNLPIP